MRYRTHFNRIELLKRFSLPLLLVSFLLIAVLPVVAQEGGYGLADNDTCVHVDEVLVTGVTGSARMRETAAPMAVLSAEALRLHPSTNIVDAISRQPGVAQITTGSGIAKPVIRGLGYNRVLVVSGGVRQEGQQWGDEHGLEVDGQGVHSAEILKGPASLMYGSDALAGVVILHDDPVLPQGDMKADVRTECLSNNGQLGYSLGFQGNRGGVVWNTRWSQRVAHDYLSPRDGYVPGTRFAERAFTGMAGLNRSWGYSRLRLSYWHLTPGITEVEEGGWTPSRAYAVALPYQQVRHVKVVSESHVAVGEGAIKATFGWQQNRRQEFEEEEADEEGSALLSSLSLPEGESLEPSLDFRLRTLTGDVRYVSPTWERLTMNVGVSTMGQQSDNLGEEVLIPAYRLFDVGTYVTLAADATERFHLSGGVRYDHRHLNSLPLEGRFEAFGRRYGALTGSLGGVYNVSEQLDVRLNVARGFRAPNMSELGSNGIHEGTFRYECGNTALRPEYSLQGDLGLEYASSWFSATMALFVNHIDNYIYLGRTPQQVDGCPVYRFRADDALLWGGEARVIVHPLHHLHVENALSYVGSRLLPDGGYLPFMPPARWTASLHYDLPVRAPWLRATYVGVEADTWFRQDRVMAEGGTETPTPGYVVANATLGGDIVVHGRTLVHVALAADNLFDTAYTPHLSRLKYADTHAVTGYDGFTAMGRNLAVKLLFPLTFTPR